MDHFSSVVDKACRFTVADSERDAGAARFCATATTGAGVISGADDAVLRR